MNRLSAVVNRTEAKKKLGPMYVRQTLQWEIEHVQVARLELVQQSLLTEFK